MAVSIQTEPTFEPGPPTVVVEGASFFNGICSYDVGPDRRLLVIGLSDATGGNAGNRINVVLNWFEELKQRVPTGR